MPFMSFDEYIKRAAATSPYGIPPADTYGQGYPPPQAAPQQPPPQYPDPMQGSYIPGSTYVPPQQSAPPQPAYIPTQAYPQPYPQQSAAPAQPAYIPTQTYPQPQQQPAFTTPPPQRYYEPPYDPEAYQPPSPQQPQTTPATTTPIGVIQQGEGQRDPSAQVTLKTDAEINAENREQGIQDVYDALNRGGSRGGIAPLPPDLLGLGMDKATEIYDKQAAQEQAARDAANSKIIPSASDAVMNYKLRGIQEQDDYEASLAEYRETVLASGSENEFSLSEKDKYAQNLGYRSYWDAIRKGDRSKVDAQWEAYYGSTDPEIAASRGTWDLIGAGLGAGLGAIGGVFSGSSDASADPGRSKEEVARRLYNRAYEYLTAEERGYVHIEMRRQTLRLKLGLMKLDVAVFGDRL